MRGAFNQVGRKSGELTSANLVWTLMIIMEPGFVNVGFVMLLIWIIKWNKCVIMEC